MSLVLGAGSENILRQCMNLSRLRWLGHMLRMENTRGNQQMTWRCGMTFTANSANVAISSQFGSKDLSNSQMEALDDMKANSEQWRSCYQNG